MLARLRPLSSVVLRRQALPAAPLGVAWRRALSDKAVTTKTASGEVSTEIAPPVDPATIQTFTGATEDQLNKRLVKIYQQAQSVQNGTQNMIAWRLQWEDDHTKRWVNPLTGWTSTSDPLSNTHMALEFHSPEDAARFCQQNGWKYEIIESKPNKEITASPKKYADNFKWKGPKGRGSHGFPDLYKPPPPPPPPPKS